MIKLFKYAVILFLCSTPSSLYSQNNTNLESNSLVLQQAKELYEELRCLVCQNQSLLESEAPLALDLKELIKEKLKEGETKKEVKDFLVERYGEFILLQPTLSLQNLFLWIGPFIFLFIGIIFAYKFYTNFNRSSNKTKTLSPSEKKNVQKILDEKLE